MDAAARQKLNGIMSDLNGVINNLSKVSSGMRSNSFSGIGNERCAQAIDDLIEKYKAAYRRLDSI